MKIRIVPGQPHAFAFGGFDIQMHRTLEVLQAIGVDAKPLDFWSRDTDFDILHMWGFDPDLHLTTARFARRYGKKIVLTPLVQYLTPRSYVRFAGSWLQGAARRRIALGELVDRFLVVNEQQGDTLQRLYRVPSDKIEVVPTILDDRFFQPAPAVSALADGFSDFLVCSGNICARKNQVRLAQAALAAGARVLFTGNVTGGEEAYAEEFGKLVAANPSSLRWHKWVEWDALVAAYRACQGVALPSFDEQQPGAALEGAAFGKPLLLGDRAYAQQKYFRNAVLVRPDSLSDIARGLASLKTEPARHVPPPEFIAECRSDRVGPHLKRIFENVLAAGL
jgi:glycosyltransferase involved in cell wall biosynthesis